MFNISNIQKCGQCPAYTDWTSYALPVIKCRKYGTRQCKLN